MRVIYRLGISSHWLFIVFDLEQRAWTIISITNIIVDLNITNVAFWWKWQHFSWLLVFVKFLSKIENSKSVQEPTLVVTYLHLVICFVWMLCTKSGPLAFRRIFTAINCTWNRHNSGKMLSQQQKQKFKDHPWDSETLSYLRNTIKHQPEFPCCILNN